MSISKHKLVGVLTALMHNVYASPMLDVRQSSPPALPSGWTFFGCYSDTPSARTIRIASFTDVANMTIESCIAFCTPAKYLFSGVEFSRECYCDNVIESPGVPINSNNCNMPCTGNAQEICGGSNAISVFQNTALSSSPTSSSSTSTSTSSTSSSTSSTSISTSSTLSSTSSPSSSTSTTSTSTVTATQTLVPTIKKTVGTFQYVGCFEDRPANQPRVLGTELTVSGGVTAESCTATCKAAGFPLAGLEFGLECWCALYMSQVSPKSDSQCNMACNADGTEFCGAGNRLTVYQDTSVPPPNPNLCLSNAILFPGAGGVPDFNFNLQMVPSSGVGAPVLLGTIFSNITIPINQKLFELSGKLDPTNLGHSFSLSGGSIQVSDVDSGFSLEPVPGGVLLFDFVSNFSTDICAVPNPTSVFGPFIGPPLLSAGGHADRWAVCSDPLTPIFSPNATHGVCSSVLLQMTPPFLV